MKNQPYDLIGDIHGHHAKLLHLLKHLGYSPQGSTFRHPAGRKVIFLGDYIDRGPAVRETLHTVRGMVDAGDALAIMGNHEYNAVSYATPDGKGGWLRPRNEKNIKQHQATLMQFENYLDEWNEWLAWMRCLPMILDLGALRAVHACWDADSFRCLRGRTFAEDDCFLFACHEPGTPERLASGHALLGPEIEMPPGHIFYDKENNPHRKLRVRWWNIPETAQVSHLAMPESFDVPGDAAPHDLRRVPNYASDEPPVFIGHYWLPPERKRAPLAPNIVCLDYSAAFGENTLTAYRWDGERVLSAEKFVSA